MSRFFRQAENRLKKIIEIIRLFVRINSWNQIEIFRWMTHKKEWNIGCAKFLLYKIYIRAAQQRIGINVLCAFEKILLEMHFAIHYYISFFLSVDAILHNKHVKYFIKKLEVGLLFTLQIRYYYIRSTHLSCLDLYIYYKYRKWDFYRKMEVGILWQDGGFWKDRQVGYTGFNFVYKSCKYLYYVVR